MSRQIAGDTTFLSPGDVHAVLTVADQLFVIRSQFAFLNRDAKLLGEEADSGDRVGVVAAESHNFHRFPSDAAHTDPIIIVGSILVIVICEKPQPCSRLRRTPENTSE